VTIDTSTGLHLRAYDEEQRSATFVASSDAIDSFGERVEQSWNLTRYLANPVVLFGHNSRELPIGRAEAVAVGPDGNLQVRVHFASEKANPLAEKVWQSIKEKTLRAVSVGFVPGKVRTEKQGDRNVYILSDNELHEISVVPIPANPEALAKMKAKAIAAAGRDNSEAAPRGEETAMGDDTKAALEAKERSLAEAHKTIADTTKALNDAVAAKAVALAEVAKMTTERDAALERATKAESAVVAVELDALVGTKIAPAEKAGLQELAAMSPALYAKQIAAIKGREDMPLLKGVIPPVGQGSNHTLSVGADDEIVALMNG